MSNYSGLKLNFQVPPLAKVRNELVEQWDGRDDELFVADC